MYIKYEDILEYWYSERMQPYWFNSTPVIDDEVRDRYESLWNAVMVGEYTDWQNSAQGCLALIIILDQFPLNMFRGQVRSFSSEAMAIEITKHAINQGYDKEIDKHQLAFMYMPLMHSENLDDQNQSVKLFQAAGLTENVKFAEHHRQLIQRYGRFPHRNAILGRESSPDEMDYLNSGQAFKG